MGKWGHMVLAGHNDGVVATKGRDREKRETERQSEDLLSLLFVVVAVVVSRVLLSWREERRRRGRKGERDRGLEEIEEDRKIEEERNRGRRIEG